MVIKTVRFLVLYCLFSLDKNAWRATATVDSQSPATEGIYEEQYQGRNHGFAGITFYFLRLFLSLN